MAEEDTPTTMLEVAGEILTNDIALYESQERRALACERAADALCANTRAVNSPHPAEVIMLAEYMITGRDPFPPESAG